MSVVAQLVEHRVVVPSVAGSIPVDRPISDNSSVKYKLNNLEDLTSLVQSVTTNIPLVISIDLPTKIQWVFIRKTQQWEKKLKDYLDPEWTN